MISRPVVFERFGGRSDELEYLAALRRAAAASRGGVALIAGEAGIGKSRLIAKFSLPSAGIARVARGACRHVAQSPFGPLDDALRALDPAYRTDVTTIDERIAGIIGTLAHNAERRTTIITPFWRAVPVDQLEAYVKAHTAANARRVRQPRHGACPLGSHDTRPARSRRRRLRGPPDPLK